MANIPGLYATGIGFTANSEDTNWALSVISGSCTTGSYAYVAADNEVDLLWDETDLDLARWLTPAQDARQNFAICTFRHRLTFTIPPQYSPGTGTMQIKYEVDDNLHILLNGAIRHKGSGYGSWTTVTINGGFMVGQNTLDLDLYNVVNNSPTGVRAYFASSNIEEGMGGPVVFSGGIAVA